MTLQEDDNIFDLIQNLLGKDHEITILEEVVDVDTQMAYFDHVHQHGRTLPLGEVPEVGDKLNSKDVDIELAKDYLVCLALTPEVKAFRILEQYAGIAEGDIRSWAIMALQENRIHLLSSFGEQQHAMISSGMGGVGHRLRYFVVMQPAYNSTFSELERDILEKELDFCLRNADSQVEEFIHHDSFSCATLLIPLNVSLPEFFTQYIASCNLLGNFLNDRMIVTNVKMLTESEIRAILAKK